MSRTQPDRTPSVRIEAENEWAWCGDRRLALTPKAFAVLRRLVEHAGRLITKDELLATIWRDAVVSDAALASAIRDVRKALQDSSQAPRYVQTVHRPRGDAYRSLRGRRGHGSVSPDVACTVHLLLGRRLDARGTGERARRPACAAGQGARRAAAARVRDRRAGDRQDGPRGDIPRRRGRGEPRPHRLRTVRGAVRRRRSLPADPRCAGTAGTRRGQRAAPPDAQAARADLA